MLFDRVGELNDRFKVIFSGEIEILPDSISKMVLSQAYIISL